MFKKLLQKIGLTASQTLELNGLPTASRILADMIALRLAQMPADAKKANTQVVFIPVKQGDIRVDCQRYVSHHRRWVEVKVQMPASPQCLSVDLTEEEQEIIAKQFEGFILRSIQLNQANRDVESQKAALIILESLL